MKFPERNENGSKNILKIKPNETVTGVFRGEVYTFRQHWENQQPSMCIGLPDCLKCKANKKANYRFQLNFVMKENAVLVAKVFEQGWKVQKQLEELNKDFPLEAHFVKITRQGNGTDTNYTILPIKNSALSKAQEAEVAKVPLNILDPASATGVAAAAVATDGPEADEEIPF